MKTFYCLFLILIRMLNANLLSPLSYTTPRFTKQMRPCIAWMISFKDSYLNIEHINNGAVQVGRSVRWCCLKLLTGL